MSYRSSYIPDRVRRTVFDAEWQARLMFYGLIAVYLPLTVAGGLYLRRKFGGASGYTL